jgi:hypothetical protein
MEAKLLKMQTALDLKVTGAGRHQRRGPVSAAPGAPLLDVNDKEADARAKAEGARLESLNQRREEIMAQSRVDVATANAALVAAQNQTAIQLLSGQVGLQQALRKQIEDEYQARLVVIDAEADKQIEALDKVKEGWAAYEQAVGNIQAAAAAKRATADQERLRGLDDTGSGRFMRDAIADGQDLVRQYQNEAAALGLVGGAAARLAFVQGKLNDAKRAGITLSAEDIAALERQADTIGHLAQSSEDAAELFNRQREEVFLLRDGLMDVGREGIKGLDGVGDAAGRALQRFAEMKFEMLAMRPLLNYLFGDDKGFGGGLVGSLLSAIPGFANGTNSAPGGMAWVGERGPELVNLPKGSQVIPTHLLRAASSMGAGRSAGGGSIVQQFDLRGAIVQEDLYRQIQTMGRQAAARGAVEGAKMALGSQPQRAAQFQKLGS